MIKHRLLSYIVCMLLCATALFAQVSVTVQRRQNPLPAQGGVYMSDPGRFFNIVVTNNSASEFLPVRLEARIEGPIDNAVDIWPNSDSYIATVASRSMPIYIPLQPGQSRVLTQTDLYNMFRQYDAGTESFGGGYLYDAFQSGSNSGVFGLLPEGHYGLKITAKSNYTDFNDPGDYLGEGICFFDICYTANPPSFNNITYINDGNAGVSGFEDNEGYYTAYFPTSNPRFSWTEPTFNYRGLTVTRQFIYDFVLYQLSEEQHPSDAVLHGGNIAYSQYGLMTPQCIVPYNIVAKLKRYKNVKYVAQVTARPLVNDTSNPAYTQVGNDGKSELLVLLMENSNAGEDFDIVVDNPQTELPINVTVEPKFTELPSALYSYFENPSELFNVTLENRSSETIPVCMLMQYYKGNWGVTAAPDKQHTNEYLELGPGARVTLSADDFDRLAGGYDIDRDVIAFKAKTGFVIGKPTSDYFPESNDTAFVRVCRYTGGKPVLRETIVGKGRVPFRTSENVMSGEMFSVTLEPKMPILPNEGAHYLTKPSRLFTLKIKSLSPKTLRIYPGLFYFVEDEVVYSGDYFKGKRFADNYITIKSGETKAFSDEEFDKFFGGFEEYRKQLKGGEKEVLTDFSLIELAESLENVARLYIFDYERLSMLDLEKDKLSQALLMEYSTSFTTSSSVKLGDVDVVIKPRVNPFPYNGDVYINSPGRLFDIELKNLTNKDLKLCPCITYADRSIDGTLYSYIPSKWFTYPEFVLKGNEKMVLDRETLNKLCGDTIATRINHSTGEKESDFKDFDEIITLDDANHLKFTLINADSLRKIPADAPNRADRVLAAGQALEFWADKNVSLTDLDVSIKLKMNPMPYNARAYFTKPEQLFEVSLSNTGDRTIEFVPMIMFEFNEDERATYLANSYKEKDMKHVLVKPGETLKLTDEQVKLYFASKGFTKITSDLFGKITDKAEFSALDADREITIDTEKYNKITFKALKPLIHYAEQGDLADFTIGEGFTSYQVSAFTRLDDVAVTVTPKLDPLPARGDIYFNSPAALFEVELKNNTPNTYKVLPSIMYLFDEFGSYYASVFKEERYDKAITVGPNEVKKLTSNELNALCGNPDTIKCFEARLGGAFVETPIPDIKKVVNLQSFNQIEVVAFSADSLKNIAVEDKNRKVRAMLGGGKSDFNAKDMHFSEVVVTVVPKADATFKPEPDEYFEKPGDLFEVTLLNVTSSEQKVGLRLTYNDRYFISKPDSVVTVKPDEKLKLTAARLNDLCGHDMYSYGAPLYEADTLGGVLGEKPDPLEIKMKEGDNKVTALVWRKLIEDQEKPTVYKVDSISKCDTIFQPALRDLWIGEYRLTVTEAKELPIKDKELKEKGYDCFKGKGHVHTTMMNVPVRVAVEFDSIYVDASIKRVVKNGVKSVTEKSAHVPLELFEENFVKEVAKTDSAGAQAKVEKLLNEAGVGAFYNYVIGNAMQTLAKVDSAAVVTLPLGLTVPMDEDLECPATIQLAQMEFLPESANLDLIGEFVLPECEAVESDILIFAARKLTTSPESFLPQSGSLGLVKSFKVKDPDSDFTFTFNAPSNQDYSKASDGCFISWKDGKFHELCASISMNLPSDELLKDDGKAALDPNVHPEITLTAFIADAEDWFATVKMDPFQVASAPGFTFSAPGDSVGIVLDRSKRRTPTGIKFPNNYKFDGKLGLSGDPGKNEKAYNEWKGFYFEELSCKLPHFVELDSVGDSRVKIGVKNVIYDASGFSMDVSVDSLFTYGTPKVGGWKITLDNIYLNIKQNSFGSSGLSGRIEVPFLCKKDTTEKAQIGYTAAIQSVAHGKKDGLAVNFRMQQLDDEVGLDFMLAKVKFNKDSTYFNVIYCDTLPKGKQTLVELCLDGKVSITCAEKIDFKLPDIPFKNMRIANFDQSLLTGKKNEKKDGKDDKKKSSGQGVESPDGNTNFHTGKWALAGEPGSDEGSYWGMPFVLDNISMEVGDGAETLGLGIEGGVVVMGNKKFGLGATVGLTIWSEIDWEETTIKYKEVEFKSMHVEGQYAGMVSVVGDLEVSDEEEKSGFDADLDVKVKGLFEIDLAGGYYKMKKTEEDLKLDEDDEAEDEYYRAGYFLAKAGFGRGLPLGPVSLQKITGGFFINYAAAVSDVDGADDMVDALEKSLKPKYKSYGGMFGVGLAVGDETIINGEATLLVMVDIQKDGIRVPGVVMQGEVHALCASTDAESGLVNGKVTIIYEDTTTPDITEEEKAAMSAGDLREKLEEKKNEHKMFKLSVTVDSDIAAMYKKFTGEEYQVKAPLSDLQALDQKSADSENKGEQKNQSSAAGKLESKGYVKSGCGATINLEFQIRNYPSQNKTFWHLYVGEPDEAKRCRITFIDFEVGKDSPVGLWAKVYANAYLCLGNELPGNGQLPAIPEKVQEALGMKGADGKVDASQKTKLDAAREQTLKGGPAGDINGGIMVGAALGAEIGCNAVFCYANVEGMLGFDLILKQYKEGIRCTDGSRAGGKNGFYATGQIYAMLKGELGLMLDLWIYKGKVPLVDMTMGALLQGGFPNPTWVYGRMRAKGSVLGGLIKFSSTIEMKAGKVCVPEMGNPLDDIKIFGDVQPGDEDIENGWSDKALVSCYGKSTFTTNMKIDKVLALVDEAATIKENGMDGDGNNVTRQYVFHLDNNFEMKEYNDSDPTNDERSAYTTYITHSNPSFDKENYELKTGSLKPNTLYRIKLRGICKELVNGEEVDPIYQDSLSGGKKEHRPFADERYVYFRTGELSDDIRDEVAGYLPNPAMFTQSLDEATQPSFMEKHVRDDYWNNPDYEFVANIRMYDESKAGAFVLPDAPEGLRKGQLSKFENLPVVEIVERGYDEDGNEYCYATVTIEKPVPGEFFKEGNIYRFEIQRINRAQLDNYMDMIEENYKSIMAMTKEDVDSYEQQLAEMDEAIAEGDAKAGDEKTNQAIRDLYNYYKEVSEMYGENEAEQRIKEYKEELKSNAQGFAEVVYNHNYIFNGYSSFNEYATDKNNDIWTWSYLPSGVSKNSVEFISDFYAKVDNVEFSGVDTRDNNPYYALNFWHSTATIVYNETPKYDFCGIPLKQYAKVPANGVTFTPSYDWLRNGNTNGKTMSNLEYETLFSPEHCKRWFLGHINPILTIEKIWDAFDSDASVTENFEKEIKEKYDYYRHFKDFKFTDAANNGTMLYGYFVPYASGGDNYPQRAAMPVSQIGLIYAADHPGDYGLRASNCGRSATNAYKYMTGEWSTFKAKSFMERIRKISINVRFCDGYNIAAVGGNGGDVSADDYGMRPLTSAKRTVNVTADLKGKGYFNSSDVSYSAEENVQIGDKALRSYLLKNYDKNGDGKMNVSEMQVITDLMLDFDKIYYVENLGRSPKTRGIVYDTIYIQSLDALKNMPNLKTLSLYNNSNTRRHGTYRKNNQTLTFDGNPNLWKVMMTRWYVDNLDFKFNPNLQVLQIDMRQDAAGTEDGRVAINAGTSKSVGVKTLNVSSNEQLRVLKVVDCNLATLDLKNITKLEEVDVRLNHLNKLDLSESYKLAIEDIKAGWQKTKNGSRYANNVYVFNIPGGISETTVIDDTTPNYYVRFTKMKSKEKVAGKLDERLYEYMSEQAKKSSKSIDDWAAEQTSLNINDLGVKSIAYLDMYMPKLKTLHVNDNELKELDLSGFSQIAYVYANNNNIRVLKVRNKNNIHTLEVSNNELATLPLDMMTELSILKCENNGIETLYPNVCKNMTELHCSGNALTELVLDKLTRLRELKCSDNRFVASNFVLPSNIANLLVFEAKRCLEDMTEIDLTSATGIKRIDVSGNAALTTLRISENATSLQYLYASDCNLKEIGEWERGQMSLAVRNSSFAKLKALIHIDVARNPNLRVIVNYTPTSWPNLYKLNVSGCNVYSVGLYDNKAQSKLTTLCVGVPQRTNGDKVCVEVSDRAWFNKWDEWKDYPENVHTTYMVCTQGGAYQYYEETDRTLETITDDDIALRKAMGETFYKYMKDKLRPDSLGYRALHTTNVRFLIALECANMDIVDLGGILKYMPNVRSVDATGNELAKVYIPLKGLKKVNLSNNSLLENFNWNYDACVEDLDLSNSYIDDAILKTAMAAAFGGDLVVNGDLGSETLTVNTISEEKAPASLTMLSKGRNLYLQSCYIPEIKFSGKSLTFASSGKYTCKTEKLLLMNEEKPVELVFQTVDMPLLWINKWIDDNPNRKFTMRVQTGNEDVNTKINGMLSFINSTTMTGSVGKLSSEMKQMANNILLPYAYSGEVPKGARFEEVLDEFGLHETRTTDDLRMGRAMGYRLYESLKSKHAPGKEYLHVEDVKSVTKFSCAGMNVPDMLTVLSYMPSVTNVNASENSIRRFIVPAMGIYDLSNGKVPLETLEFARKAISLDLTNTVINREVFAEAIKNVTTNLKVTHEGEVLSINDSSNKLGELMILAGLNIYRCKIQTLNYRGKFLTLRGDLDAVSIGNLRLNTATNTNISFTSADVALNFIANWSQNNPVDTEFNIVLLGGNVSACTSALEAFNNEAAAGRGFTEVNKKLAIDAIVDCANKGYVAKGGKYDSMLDELGLAPKAKPWAVKLNNAGANVLNVITAMRSHCGYGLLEAKRYCENAPSVVGTFDTQEEAVALKRDIEYVGGLAVVLHNGVEVAEPAKKKGEAADCDVVLTSTGASKISVIRALQSVCGITLVQANTLVKTLPVVIATGKTNTEAQAIKSEIEAAGGSVNISSQKSEFNVVLTSYGSSKVAVIKAVQNLTGLGLLNAKNLVDSAPVIIVTVGSLSEAEAAKAAIEEAGGTAAIE